MVDEALMASSKQEIADMAPWLLGFVLHQESLVPGILCKLDRWCNSSTWYPGIKEDRKRRDQGIQSIYLGWLQVVKATDEPWVLSFTASLGSRCQ
jgi:hypothetical protein